MKINIVLGVVVGKFVYYFLSKMGCGFIYLGSLVFKFDKDILDIIVKDYEIVVVIGINGKILIIVLIVGILKEVFG